MKKVWETCPHCDEEVELNAVKYIKQVCPSCGKLIRPCAMCTEIEYSTGCNQCEEAELSNQHNKNITLTTYGNEKKEIEFIVSRDFFNAEIRVMGWKNKKEFMGEYVFDDSLPIYEKAKELNLIIKEEFVNAF